jgi:ribosomal protein S18 acetylase RimI-like enzyme
MIKIEIKDVSIRDEYKVIDQLMQWLHESEKGFFDKTAAWQDISQSYMRHVITMQEEAEGTCLIAYHNNEPVGFIFGYVEEQDDSRIEIYKGKELYVSDGYVKPSFRAQGIYRQLNQVLEEKYLGKGVKRITRYTQTNNKPMQRFLNAAGYMPTRILFEKWL